jgi:hypothetical protein
VCVCVCVCGVWCVCVWVSKGSLQFLCVFQCDLPLFFSTEYLLVKSYSRSQTDNVKLSTLLGSGNRSGHCRNDHLRSLHALFPPFGLK